MALALVLPLAAAKFLPADDELRELHRIVHLAQLDLALVEAAQVPAQVAAPASRQPGEVLLERRRSASTSQ